MPIENDKHVGLSPEDDRFLERVLELYGKRVRNDCESRLLGGGGDRKAILREARNKRYDLYLQEFVDLVELPCGSYPREWKENKEGTEK